MAQQHANASAAKRLSSSRLVFTDGEWREVAIAIAASARVTAEQMRHLIADFDAGPKSSSGKSPSNQSTTSSRSPQAGLKLEHFTEVEKFKNNARWLARSEILNPQPNPQNAMSCTTSAYFGSPRGLVSCCKTYSRSAVTAEVASSSLVVPAISNQALTEMASSRHRHKKVPNWHKL